MSDSRKQFEAHLRQTSPACFDLRRAGGVYTDPSTQAGWELWQASRLFLLRQIRALEALSVAGLSGKR